MIKAVSKYEQKLFGKFKGSARGKPEREAAWEEVARTVNEYVLLLKFCSQNFIYYIAL